MANEVSILYCNMMDAGSEEKEEENPLLMTHAGEH
jgi:hypothetical protein